MALGWPVSAERPGAGLADLAGGQVQVDERGVLGRAAAGLVQALAVQAEVGATLGAPVAIHAGKPACGGQQVGLAMPHTCATRSGVQSRTRP
jgi:hypothetical protein